MDQIVTVLQSVLLVDQSVMRCTVGGSECYEVCCWWIRVLRGVLLVDQIVTVLQSVLLVDLAQWISMLIQDAYAQITGSVG